MKLSHIISVAAAGLVLSTVSAKADDTFAMLAEIDAVPMSADQMAEVRGANHVIRLVLQQSGKEAMPTDAATEATDRAGSIDGRGNDRPAIVRKLD